MKKRRGILFALGIVLSLSVAVPAVAAENVTGTTVTQDSVENEQAQEASKENERTLMGKKKKSHRHGKNMKQRTAMFGG